MKRGKYEAAATGIVLILLLLTTTIKAQQQDSTLLYQIDTVVSNDVQPPAEITLEEQDEEEEEYDEENESSYFLPKWNPGSGLDSLYLRRLDDSVVSKLKNDEDFWYANKVFKEKKKKEEEQERDSSNNILQPLLWLLIIGGFITFLVIYLSNSNVGVFRKSKTISTLETEVETDDIFAIPYQKEIDKAVNAGNYRLAVRLHFLRLLRDLSEKNLIRYAADRTNFDYLLQVQHTAWYQHFFRLTRNYEYVWYGQFEIDGEKFNIIKNDFTDLEKQLR